MKTIETVGKDIEQALEAGLAELGCKIDDVEVKIIQHPGIFRKARVRFTYQSDDNATVEKKTAAAVMRNLEERAARVSNFDSKKSRNNDKRRADVTSRSETPDRNQNNNWQSQNKRAPQNNAQVQPKAKENGAVGLQRVNKKETERPQKNENKRESRAELETSSVPNVRANTLPNVRTDTLPVKKPERNIIDVRKKPEQVRESASPEAIAAAAEKAASYLKDLTNMMGMPTDVETIVNDGGLDIRLIAENDNLIGSRGETLEAIEHLTMLAANGGENRLVRINLDCGGFRKRMTANLVSSALEAADKVAATGKRIELPTMNSSARRVVHAALSVREDVITRSEGREPYRFIVILPKRADGAGGNANVNRRPNGNFANNRRRNWNNQGRKNGGGKDSGAE